MEANGWSFDLADYGYENGYILNPDQYVFCTVNLTNEAKYGEDNDLDVSIGLINNTDKPLDITECDIYAFECDIYWELDEGRPLPTITLPGGFSWGATLDEIIAKYGEPNDTYIPDSDTLKYTTITYETEEGQTLELTIYDKEGLTSVHISNK